MSIAYYKNITLTLAIVFLFSCSSTKLAYNYADFFVLNWFESYIDLNESQRSDFKKRVEIFFVWHRKSELPKVILFLEDIKTISRIPTAMTMRMVNHLENSNTTMRILEMDYNIEFEADFFTDGSPFSWSWRLEYYL